MKRIFPFLISLGLAGLAITSYFASGPKTLTTVEAASLRGTATVSGTVDSAKPFKAAQVFFRNPVKRMLYMVYTAGGHYQAMNLFPGDYEVSVSAKGLSSDVTKLTLKAGQEATVNMSLRESTESELKKDVEYLPFREIYPPGPGLQVAAKTCFYCHGESFLPSKHWDAKQWNVALDLMTGVGNRNGTMIQAGDMNQQDRETLLQYLVQNFGPDSKARAVKIEVDMPVDEAKLAKAEYIEYYFPVDPPGKGVNDPEYASKNEFRHRRVGQDPQLDADGNVWVTDRGYPNRISRLDPRTGEWKEYLTPQPKAGVHDLNIDKDGIIWVPENEGIPAGHPKLLSFNPKTEKWESAYPFNPDKVIPEGVFIHAQSIAIDSKQNAYVVHIYGNGLAKWNRETKKITTWRMPSSDSMPYGVVVDKNDNVWIAESRRSKVVKLDAKTGVMTEYETPTHPALIRRLNVDDTDGTTIWFGLFSNGKLEKLDQATGKITEYKIPLQVSQPYDTVVENGEVWISDAGQGGALIKFNPKNETFTFYPSPQKAADKPKIRLTREGAIWYSPRSSQQWPGLGVLYPDMTKITTLGAYRRPGPGGRWVGN